MAIVDDKLTKILNNLLVGMLADSLSDEAVDYKDVIKGEIIPAIKEVFGYTQLDPLPVRQEAFRQSIMAYTEKYDHVMLQRFYNYWVELKTERGRLMRFEKETTWMLAGRLARWHSKNKSDHYSGLVKKAIDNKLKKE